MTVSPAQHPDFCTTIGKKGKTVEPVTDIKHHYQVVDEVTHVQSDNVGKVIILQKIQFDDGKMELRLGYYIIGKKPKMEGRWVGGQYATFTPVLDFQQIIAKAQAKGWL